MYFTTNRTKEYRVDRNLLNAEFCGIIEMRAKFEAEFPHVQDYFVKAETQLRHYVYTFYWGE